MFFTASRFIIADKLIALAARRNLKNAAMPNLDIGLRSDFILRTFFDCRMKRIHRGHGEREWAHDAIAM